MAVVEQLLRSESDGTISFGNHKLAEKAKLEDFEHAGDLYKVKTYKTMTKLEKNGLFVYESVPGTSVTHFREHSDHHHIHIRRMIIAFPVMLNKHILT